ncbi:MAG: DHA2 family efflux MFS transporter permease subunit [Pseudomonadota bacterium]|nr:DHA2 family efflux MFS transporter permease subunit [Pseudomonadota bacterium]
MLDSDQAYSRAALEQRFGPRFRWYVLATVMIGTVASIMASTIVNVAVPDISRVFALGQDQAQWLSAGFMGAMTLSMLTTPWLLARYGYRHAYVGAVLLLMTGGILGGLGTRFDVVLSMRVVEGLAAGVLQPIPAIIILHAFAPHERGKAMGIFGFGVVLAPAIGPSVGGILVEWFGWRSIFFVVTPFCIVATALALRFLPIGAPGGKPVNRDLGRLDVVGLLLLAIAVVTLLNGMVHLHASAFTLGLGLLAVSAVVTVGFILHQRHGARPLMALGLFGHRAFSMGGTVAFIYGMALFGSTYLVPVFMQVALKLPPSQAGAVLLPAGLVLAVTIPIAGRAADHIAVNRIVSAGLVLLAVSFFLMTSVDVATSLALITVWAAVGRLGLGFILPSLNLGSMHGLPENFISHGSSTINFLRQLGGAVGIGLVGNVLEWRLREHASRPLAAFHETFILLGAITACATLAAWRMGATRRPLRPLGDAATTL